MPPQIVKRIADITSIPDDDTCFTLASKLGNLDGMHRVYPNGPDDPDVYLGFDKDCHFRDLIFEEIARERPVSEVLYGFFSDKTVNYFYRKIPGDMKLSTRLKLSNQRYDYFRTAYDYCFYHDVDLTDEITIRIYSDGQFNVYNGEKRIYGSDLFILHEAYELVPYREEYTELRKSNFMIPLIKLN